MMKKIEPQVTEFQKRVYAATRRIPRGKVTTYKSLAQAIGCGSSQAVGQALSVNPFAPHPPFTPPPEFLTHFDPADVPPPLVRSGATG